jgi:hypothetical protein
VTVLLVNLVACAAASWLLLYWCRQISAFDRWLGIIVHVGVLARLSLGGLLFWASYLDWPPLKGLHSADGFWQLAPDARSYFLLAAEAAEHGLHTIETGSPSPTFVAVLALWMRAVGVTPTAAVLLNTLLAVGACRGVIGLLVDDRSRATAAGRVVMAGLALSPAMVLFAAQGLKDQFIATMLVMAAVGVVRWLGAQPMGSPAPALGGFLLTAFAVLMIAGVRAYLCVILIGALAVALGWQVTVAGRRVRGALLASAALVTLWMCFLAGAGVYYQPYGAMLGRLVPSAVWATLPTAVTTLLTGGVAGTSAAGVSLGEAMESARTGFVRTPGATNLAVPGGEPSSRVERVARGLAATLVPVTLLKAIGIVEFTGGRGLLVVTDLDTAVNVSLTIWVVALLAPAAGRLVRLPYVVYAGTFAVGVLLPLAYTVTNFGTLFRLRLMAFTLVWLVALGLACRRPRDTHAARPGS